MAKQKRMQFIDTLQAVITTQLVAQGVPAHIVRSAFDQWHAGKNARTPMELGCFKVFEQVEADVNKLPK